MSYPRETLIFGFFLITMSVIVFLIALLSASTEQNVFELEITQWRINETQIVYLQQTQTASVLFAIQTATQAALYAPTFIPDSSQEDISAKSSTIGDLIINTPEHSPTPFRVKTATPTPTITPIDAPLSDIALTATQIAILLRTPPQGVTITPFSSRVPPARLPMPGGPIHFHIRAFLNYVIIDSIESVMDNYRKLFFKT